jgi:putative ABC transport system substrate-binding protein
MEGDSTKRRKFLAGLGIAPIVTSAVAQPARPLLVILSPVSPNNEVVMRSVNRPFKEALFKLGYEPGRNIDIAERFAEGDESRLPALAAELVALRPQVLFTHTSYAAVAAAHATRSIPIVVGPAGENTLRELAGGSLARPSTNVTGFVLGNAEMDDKCITLLMEAVPSAFLKGLQDLGYVDGKNITLEIRSSSGKPEALPGAAAELVQLKADVIFVTGPAPIRAVLAATRSIPVVALDLETEPVRAGRAQSLARPGGNLTGLFLDLPGIAGKWLQLLREAAPRAQRVGVLWDSSTGPEQLDAARAAALGMGVELIVMEIPSAEDFEPVLAAGLKAGMRALMQLSSPLVSTLSRQSAAFAAQQRLPGISAFRRFADEGGLLSYGPVRVDMYRNAATFVAKILKGARPGELAIEQPARFELVVNLKAAKALGLAMAQALLLRADEVIE